MQPKERPGATGVAVVVAVEVVVGVAGQFSKASFN